MANETEPTRQSNWHNREWRKKSEAIVEDNNDKKLIMRMMKLSVEYYSGERPMNALSILA